MCNQPSLPTSCVAYYPDIFIRDDDTTGFWIRSGVEETPKFKEMEANHSKAKTPVSDVFRHYWRRLLIAGGVRIGSDVLYALVVVFTLTYVTTVLNLSRTLALTAIMMGTACNALTVPLFGALSDRIGRRPVNGGPRSRRGDAFPSSREEISNGCDPG